MKRVGDEAYPSRLAVELRARLPGREITVLNRGVNGEETANMMARFSTDVLDAHPQLVLWHIGTNSVLRDHPLSPHAARLHDGIEQLKAAGADVVLIDRWQERQTAEHRSGRLATSKSRYETQ